MIKAYNENLPYDQFVIWQLAGDLLDHPTNDQLLATSFNRNHPQTQEGGIVDEEYRVEYVADRTNTFGKAFMGLTMECARCHDHKYDPISQKDYYSLYAFFNNNNESGIVPYNGEASPTVFLPEPEVREKLDELTAQIDSLESQLQPEHFYSDFKNWYDQLDRDTELDLSYKKLADFSFEKTVIASNVAMNLDRLSATKLKKLKKKNVEAFVNSVKNQADATYSGDKDRSPEFSNGVRGNGLRFRGDAGIRFNRDLDIDRNEPISVSLWIRPLRDSLEGPIFNNTNGDFEGYRGWLCKLNMDGTLSFQFNHVWPDNAIDIRTQEVIPVNKWTHIAMSYDGTSKANGIRIFLNGNAPERIVYQDKLYKSLLHGKDKSNWSDLPFMLGMELRKTIEDLEMDELKVYNRQLSRGEIRALMNHRPYSPEGLDEQDLIKFYLFSGKNQKYNQLLNLTNKIRGEHNLLATDEKEVMIMQERKVPRPTYVLDRGLYDQPAFPVNGAIPKMFADHFDVAPSDRLELAQWLVSNENPLTARVAVNRIWKMLFGQGLVGTQEDFGNQGSLPTHPELLDWLALKYMELNWDTKAFLKLVMTSATYVQSSTASDQAKISDPDDILYSHYPAHRMSAEQIRDHALASSGLLVREIGGPSVYPYQPPGLWKALATRNETVYKQQHGDSLYRRSMYTIWKRSSPPPNMLTFDAPDRYYCVVDRQKTSTPLQSLILMNDVQFLEASRVLAEKMIRQESLDPVEYAFLALIGRKPDQNEYRFLKLQFEEAFNQFKGDSSTSLAWLKNGEYKMDRSLDQAELAAHTMIASTIMNFDEFVMKR